MFKNKVVWIIIAIVAILFFWVKGVYNNMVTQDEGVKTAWSQVENQYQRRMDLIPNLVNTVKGYAAHEKETLEGVVNARAEATKTTIDPSNLTEESLKKFQSAQGELGNALSFDACFRALSRLKSESKLYGASSAIGRDRKSYLGRA